jgi:hypothetical protein
MRSRNPERARAVATPRERTHQAERGYRSIRIHRNQSTPPLERRGWRTLDISPGKGFERAHATLGEPIALGLHPPLELRCIAQEEAVQKSALIQRGRFLQRTSLEGTLEIVDVTPDDFCVQCDRVGAQKDIVPQLAAERIEQLLERVTRVIGWTLRPEVSLEFVTRHPALTRDREESQQRDAAALRRASRLRVGSEREPTEHLQPKHETTVRKS